MLEDSRQAGAQFEITPAMIEAGVYAAFAEELPSTPIIAWDWMASILSAALAEQRSANS